MSSKLIIRAASKEKVERVPIWVMRQAGRYLPEYRKLREKYSFMEMYKNPEIACEVTLMPIKRFKMDAAIIFSDILVVPEAMGQKLIFNDDGPVFPNPIRNIGDINKLHAASAKESISYTLEALKFTKNELSNTIALFGFSGAPLTLACYMVEGKLKNMNCDETKRFILNDPKNFKLLLDKITSSVIDYLESQIECGIDALQIFDSWAANFTSEEYNEFGRPYVCKIIDTLKNKYKDIKIIYFINNICRLIEELKNLKADVLSVDSNCPLLKAARLGFAVQGNLDPTCLLKDKETIRRDTLKVLKNGMKLDGYIFNLGHGVLPKTPVDNMQYLVDMVREHGIY